MDRFSPSRIFESNPRLPDIAALFALLVLTFLFYYPSAGPLESRYMYYSDPVERSLSVCTLNTTTVFNGTSGRYFLRWPL